MTPQYQALYREKIAAREALHAIEKKLWILAQETCPLKVGQRVLYKPTFGDAGIIGKIVEVTHGARDPFAVRVLFDSVPYHELWVHDLEKLTVI